MSNNPDTPNTPETREADRSQAGGPTSDPTRALEADQPPTPTRDTTEPVWATEGPADRTESLDTAILGRPDEVRSDGVRSDEVRSDEGRQPHFGLEAPAQAWPPSVPPRPSGPHLPPILLGLVCLAIALLAMWQELGDVSIDWGNVGPLGIVAIGGLLVVLGLAGVLSSRRRAAR